MTTYIFAGEMTIDGTPVNQKRFYNGNAANKFKSETETRNGFWSLVKKEELAATYKDCIVYRWTEEKIK